MKKLTSSNIAAANSQNSGQMIKQFFGDVKNIVTKFAFATRMGYIPNNPYKTNQDAFILAPNLLGG